MGRRHRQPVAVGGEDRRGGNKLGRGTLAVGGWVLPIFSPTVTTMRFQPIMVPRPSAMATAILTQNGMNLVASSSDFLYHFHIRVTWLCRGTR
jgi:hypothetical protein